MWLLDKNVPVQLVAFLYERGVPAVAAETKGWGALKNGELVSSAAREGISCILTRDKLFAQSAAAVLNIHRDLSIIVVTLPQLKAALFLDAFARAWSAKPILATPGEVVRWPEAA